MSEIEVITGIGVKGDAHGGATVKHRSRVAVNPNQPNLRQVHLIQVELYKELEAKGFEVGPADLGENVTTAGIDLLSLPRHTLLRIGGDVELEVSGLRNPRAQIDHFQRGLLAAVLDRGPNNEVFRKAGIMTLVRAGGLVRPGDRIDVEMPPLPHLPLERVQRPLATTSRPFARTTGHPDSGHGSYACLIEKSCLSGYANFADISGMT